MKIVFDACAAIAFFRGEAGAEVVERYLLESQYDCMIHSMNLCEIYYDFYRSSGEAFAETIVNELQEAGVMFRSDLTRDFWQQAGKYKATIARISLADCFALTLANREDGILVTSDRREFEPVVALNLCQIEFIR